MLHEINDYKQLEAEIKEKFEIQYLYAMSNGELGEAYNILGKMMEYRLIDPDDARIEIDNKSFRAAGIDKNHRFLHDYRCDNGYNAPWLYGNLGYSKTIGCDTIEHIGRRVEGAYGGDTVITSSRLKLRVFQCSNRGQAGAAGTILDAELKMNGKIRELVEAGVYRIYSIEIKSVCNKFYKHLGYALVKSIDGNIVGTLYPNYDALVQNWLPIKETVLGIGGTIESLINGKVTVGKSWESAIIEQGKLIENSNNLEKANEKLLNRSNH